MKVALYARVSKANCHQDPEVQLNDLRAHCLAQGWTVAEEYVDKGWSGSKANRPELDRLMRDATRGLRDFDAVVVWKLDRFGRSVQHLHNTLARLHEAGVVFVSQKDGFDLTTTMGKLMFSMLAAFAEFERNVIAERVKAGFRKPGAKRPGRKIVGMPSRTTLWRRRRTEGASR